MKVIFIILVLIIISILRVYWKFKEIRTTPLQWCEVQKNFFEMARDNMLKDYLTNKD